MRCWPAHPPRSRRRPQASTRPTARSSRPRPTLRATLATSLVAPRFEARLGARLAGVGGTPWILRHPGRLIVTGAVGSAVGVGVTAYAVWRSRSTHRLLHR